MRGPGIKKSGSYIWNRKTSYSKKKKAPSTDYTQIISLALLPNFPLTKLKAFLSNEWEWTPTKS
jgi:hypothetical protein